MHLGERREPDRVGVGHGRALGRRERLALLEREGEAAARRERLGRAGLAVTWQQDNSRAHRATAQALLDAYAADAEAIAGQLGGRALGDLLAAHRLWIDWLDEGRVRKLALVAERGPIR